MYHKTETFAGLRFVRNFDNVLFLRPFLKFRYMYRVIMHGVPLIFNYPTTFVFTSNFSGPNGNLGNSYLTFRSRPALMFFVILFFSQTTFNFCDQASWQSRIAAKPEQGAVGFIIAAFLWFGISVTITLTTSFTYLAMSYQNGTELLSINDIESGNFKPTVRFSTFHYIFEKC